MLAVANWSPYWYVRYLTWPWGDCCWHVPLGECVTCRLPCLQQHKTWSTPTLLRWHNIKSITHTEHGVTACNDHGSANFHAHNLCWLQQTLRACIRQTGVNTPAHTDDVSCTTHTCMMHKQTKNTYVHLFGSYQYTFVCLGCQRHICAWQKHRFPTLLLTTKYMNTNGRTLCHKQSSLFLSPTHIDDNSYTAHTCMMHNTKDSCHEQIDRSDQYAVVSANAPLYASVTSCLLDTALKSTLPVH